MSTVEKFDYRDFLISVIRSILLIVFIQWLWPLVWVCNFLSQIFIRPAAAAAAAASCGACPAENNIFFFCCSLHEALLLIYGR